MASERDPRLEDVRELAARGRVQQALTGYRELCEADPYDPDLWLERAAVAEAAGRIDDATRSLFHVVDLYAQAGMGEAIEIAERLLVLDPAHRGALQFLRAHAPGRWGGDDDGDGDGVPEPIPDAMDDIIPLVVPGNPSGAVAVPIADSIPMPMAASDSMALPQPRPGTLSGPVAQPQVSGDSDRVTQRAVRSRTDRQRAVAGLLVRLERCPLLDALDDKGLLLLSETGHLRHVDRGGVVFRQGDKGDSLFLVLEGSIDIERYHPVLDTVVRLSSLPPGAFFGEHALVAGVPRSATVRARRPTTLLEIGRDTVRTLSRRYEALLLTLMRFFRARLVGALMATSPLFHPFSAEERRALVGRFRVRELPAQEIVMRQGRLGDGLYVVLIGTLIVFVTDAGGRARKLGVLGPGDVFGEMSLIHDEPVMASVGTHTRAWILRLPRQDFEAMVAAHPEVLERLADIASVRDAQNQGILNSRRP
ncbi:cyclic nucleotide-binding domain-containing protein [Haliangium sp.]|uniref:cyclic nucleotide-binding domain-containing protein n=1 Tax=Haliangium sp. TaxID=2663208 RepID=UPI003D112ED5